MPLTPAQTLASIAVMAVVTFLTRALPFILFDRGDHPPKLVLCVRGVSVAAPSGWLPALAAGLAAVLLHLWKGNDLISIFGATVFYMVLVQGVFG